MQGPYLRVAGSTKDSGAPSLAPTSTSRSRRPGRDGRLPGEVNVAGSMIYRRRRRNDDDQVVGCIVVGRIAEL